MTRAALAISTFTALGAMLAGCASTPSIPADAGEGSWVATDAAFALAALEPVSLRVHPLTRLERGPDGEPRIAVHLALLDGAGQETKWLGRVTVMLRVGLSNATEASGQVDDAAAPDKPSEQPSGTSDEALRYVRDLVDAEANARTFDWVSRCYIIHCGGLPEWAVSAAKAGRLNVDAAFATLNIDGTRSRLQATGKLGDAQ